MIKQEYVGIRKNLFLAVIVCALMMIGVGSARAQTVVATVSVGSPPAAVAVNPVTNRIYVANAGGNMTVIDGATDTSIATVTGAGFGIAVNSVTNKIYSGSTVIDGATNTSVTVGNSSFGFATAVNEATNMIYSEVDNAVTVIDGVTNRTTTVGAGPYPFAIAVNSVTNKIYVPSLNDEVTVIDGATNSTTTVSLGPDSFSGTLGVSPIAVNPATNKVYVTNWFGGYVTVIDGVTNNTNTVSTGIAPMPIVVNPVTNKIYVGNAASNNVTVIDGATNNTTTVGLAGGAYTMAINPLTNRIYVVSGAPDDKTAGTMTVIDGATNNTTMLSVGLVPGAIAVNPVTNKIYVANIVSNTVTVIYDGQGSAYASLQAIVAGSSAMWRQMGQAMVGISPQQNCTWTHQQNVDTYLKDERRPNVFDTGNLWVVWTPGNGGTCVAPATDSQVYAYINTDSTVGNRCLFALPQCMLKTTAGAGSSGANLLPGVIDTPLPQVILNTFNNQPVTIAATDILPADAAFATYSTESPCGRLSEYTQFVGLCYGTEPVPINSSFSTNSLNVMGFSLIGPDPYNYNSYNYGMKARDYTIIQVGAAPVLILVNTTNQNPTGFGDPRVKNINRSTLAGYLTGFLGRTADVLPQPFAGANATYYGTTTLIPEPISGAYRVMEHTIPNNKEFYKSQDFGNYVGDGTYLGVISNPLYLTRTIGGTISFRKRVIGTAETISQLTSANNPDSIGYAFWSTANFANTSNIKYLTVDGVDPLFDAYSDGTLPQSGNNLLPNVTLSHIKDGTYPLWSTLRLVTLNEAATTVAQTMANAAQNLVSFGPGATNPDFVPFNQMNVFHAHYQPGISFNDKWDGVHFDVPADGVCGPNGPTEAGGDAGGMVFTAQSGADFCVLKNNYGDPIEGVGPTNTASFGVRQ